MITVAVLLALTCSSLACYFTIKLVKPIALKVGLVDIPNHRKVHSGEVPLVGGISVYIGVLTASAVIFPEGQILNLYLISSGLIVMLGALDDFKDLSVGLRIVAQILVASLMVYGAGLHLNHFGDILFGLNTNLGWFGYPITIVATIAAINAFNMTDGIDGLAGSLSLVAFSGIAILMFLNSDSFYLLPLILVAAMVPFLFFNLGIIGGSAKKIFMGDAGSMFVGLSIVWLLVIGTQGEYQSFRPVTALWLIGIPFLDMCAITIRRLLMGRSPFSPDREHIHHIVMRLGLSARSALGVITAVSVIMAGFGLLGEYYQWSETLMFLAFLLLFVVYFYALKHAWRVSTYIRRLKNSV